LTKCTEISEPLMLQTTNVCKYETADKAKSVFSLEWILWWHIRFFTWALSSLFFEICHFLLNSWLSANV